MTFGHPYLFLLLLLPPLLAWLKGRRGQPPAFLYSSVRLLVGLTRARRSRAGAFLAALRWLVLVLFIVALTQPRWMKSQTTVKASGIDIVCALDLSGSMNTGGLSSSMAVKSAGLTWPSPSCRSLLKGGPMTASAWWFLPRRRSSPRPDARPRLFARNR